MAVDHELRHNVRRSLFTSVSELADLEFQRATWLDPEMQNPHYGYVEFVECFYDLAAGSYDADDPASDKAPLRHWVGSGVLTQAEMDVIWPLHLALRVYRPQDCYDHNAILDDPAWQSVSLAASNAKDGLARIGLSPEELNYFKNELPNAAAKRWP